MSLVCPHCNMSFRMSRGNLEEKRKRNALIAKQFQSGKFLLKDLAALHNLTPPRVSQILADQGVRVGFHPLRRELLARELKNGKGKRMRERFYNELDGRAIVRAVYLKNKDKLIAARKHGLLPYMTAEQRRRYKYLRNAALSREAALAEVFR